MDSCRFCKNCTLQVKIKSFVLCFKDDTSKYNTPGTGEALIWFRCFNILLSQKNTEPKPRNADLNLHFVLLIMIVYKL